MFGMDAKHDCNLTNYLPAQVEQHNVGELDEVIVAIHGSPSLLLERSAAPEIALHVL